MADGDLGSLIVSIGTDLKDLDKGLSQAQKNIAGFQQTANKVLGLIGFSLTAAAFVNLGKATIEYGEQLNKLAVQTGLSAAEIAKLKYVAEQSETSVEAVAQSFRFLSRSMNEAASGNAQAIQTFAKFHVEFKNSDGTLRDYQSVMLDVADRIKNTSNQTVVLAEGQKLLGRNVMQILPLLKEGADGIKKLTDHYDEMQKRVGMTDEQINKFAKDSDALSDAWKDVGMSFQFMMIEVLTPLIPKIKELEKWLIEADWKSVGDFIVGIADGFKAIGDEIQRELKLLEDFNNGLLVLGDTIGVGPLARFFGGATSTPGGPFDMQAGLDQMKQGPPQSNFFGPKGAGTEENPVDLGTVSTGKQGAVPGSGQAIDAQLALFDTLKQKMQELKTEWQDVNKQIGETWKEGMTMITTGFGQGVADMVVDGKNFGDSMKELWKDVAKMAIAEIFKIIAQQIILFGWQVITGTVGSGNIMPGGGGKKFLGIFRDGGAITSARNGLYAASGIATTGNMGESGIPVMAHPNEIISPIDKFFQFFERMRPSNITVNANGRAGDDPYLLAQLVQLEADRQLRRP